MKTGFLDKLIERLDRLDPKSVQTHFLRLVQERGLLETIFQSIQEGVIVIDENGQISYANKAAEQLIGFSLGTAKGISISRYLKEIDWERVLKLDIGEWSKLINREIEITYPEHKFINFYIVPLREAQSADQSARNLTTADSDAGRGAVVILRDVTRDRMQEESLLESERLNAVKLLAAGVAHEIGNPLNALNIHLQLLDREINRVQRATSARHSVAKRPIRERNEWRGNAVRRGKIAGRNEEGKDDINIKDLDKLKELVGVARNEVSRLDLIITQFLRAIRPSKPEFVVCRVEDILKEILTLLKQEIQDRKVEVEIIVNGTLPGVSVDRNQIKQAFFNVIRNAVQAMQEGGGLKITLSSSDQYLSISFRDTGIGIKREDFGRIFEPYYTTKSGGSGLGLMIVQRIIQDHGGQIEIVSKPDAGTTFTILLPLVERRVRLLKAHDRKQKTEDGRQKTDDR